MKFMLMLTQDAGAWDREPQAEKDRVYNLHMRVVRQLEEQKKLVDSRRLRPSIEAKTVRVKDGRPVAVDGPFSETKEVLGGYYVIECGSMEEAIDWAKKMPHFGDLRFSGIEVRPIWE
jgi:hypothetical protein